MGLVDWLSGALGAKNKFQAQAPVNEFNADQADLATSDFGGTIDAAQQENQALAGQQSAFMTDLLGAARGEAPSVAENQLREATTANMRNAASTAASARGVNPALAARLATDTAAGANQGAAGQAATLRAGEMATARGQVVQAQQGQRAQALGALGAGAAAQQGQNANTLQNVLGTNQINAAVAQQNAALNLGAQQINAGVAAQNAQTNAGLAGGLLNAAGSVFGGGMAEGGEVPGYSAGGGVGGALQAVGRGLTGQPEPGKEEGGDALDAILGGIVKSGATALMAARGGEIPDLPGDSGMGPTDKELAAWVMKNHIRRYAFGDQVLGDPTQDPLDALLPAQAPSHAFLAERDAAAGAAGSQPGGKPAPGAKPKQPTMKDRAKAAGRDFIAPMGANKSWETYNQVAGQRILGAPMASGGRVFKDDGTVPGKPKHPGVDTEANDTVPALLTPKEIVLPLSVTQAEDAPERARDFVAHIMKRQGRSGGYERVAKANAKVRAYEEGGEVEEEIPDDESPGDRVMRNLRDAKKWIDKKTDEVAEWGAKKSEEASRYFIENLPEGLTSYKAQQEYFERQKKKQREADEAMR